MQLQVRPELRGALQEPHYRLSRLQPEVSCGGRVRRIHHLQEDHAESPCRDQDHSQLWILRPSGRRQLHLPCWDSSRLHALLSVRWRRLQRVQQPHAPPGFPAVCSNDSDALCADVRPEFCKTSAIAACLNTCRKGESCHKIGDVWKL